MDAPRAARRYALILTIAAAIIAAFIAISLPSTVKASPDYIPSDNLIYSDDEEVYSGQFEEYYLIKGWTLTIAGELRIDFDLRTSNSLYRAYGVILKNGGYPAGTYRDTHSEEYETFTENIGGWSIDDYIELWIMVETEGEAVYTQNFRIYGSEEVPAGAWKAIETWTGTVSASAAWQSIETWTGTINATVQWLLIESWTGTVNTSAQWYEAEAWTGTVSAPVAWSVVESWVGTVEAPAAWSLVESWTGAVSAPAEWKLIETWTGTIEATTTWQLVETWIGTVNAPVPAQWNQIESWTGTVSTPAEWRMIETWMGVVNASAQWLEIEIWTGTVNTPAPPAWQIIETWTGTVQTPPPPPSGAWHEIEAWTGAVGALWYETETWAGAVVAPADVWYKMETWDGILNAGVPPSKTPPVEIGNPAPMIGIAIFFVCIGIAAAVVFMARRRSEEGGL